MSDRVFGADQLSLRDGSCGLSTSKQCLHKKEENQELSYHLIAKIQKKCGLVEMTLTIYQIKHIFTLFYHHSSISDRLLAILWNRVRMLSFGEYGK